MQNIFYGMLLVCLNFTFSIGSVKIGLLPDFVGYILMMKGIDEIVHESSQFVKIKPYIMTMVVYTCLLYIGDLFGLSIQINGFIASVLGLIAVIIAFYISYTIISGIREIEKNDQCNLNGEILHTVWIVRVICSMVVYIAIVIPILILPVLFIGLIVNIYFLVVFNRTKNLYYERQKGC